MDYNYTFIDIYEDAGWDESQMVDITIIQRIMGSISLIGSTYVIQDVLRNEQKRKHSTFHRLMVGVSISDILSSFFVHILSTAPMPKAYHVLAVGSVATCDVQGFFTVLCAVVTILYNCSLATYYIVQLKYNWVNRRIKALEKWLHIVPWSVGFILSIAGLVFKIYGPHSFICGPTGKAYPIECTFPDSSVECIRGSSSEVIFFIAAMIGTIFLSICYIAVTMYMVYRSVSNIEIQAQKYTFARFKSQNNHRKRSRRVMLQGVLYNLALLLTYVFNIFKVLTAGKSYIVHIFMYTFWPMQGFFNALIYSIPVFIRMCKRWKINKKKKQQQTALLLKSQEETMSESFSSQRILSKLSKNTKKQSATSFNLSSNMTSKSSNININANINIKNLNDKGVIHNNQHNQPALLIRKMTEEGKNNKFDGEEVQEEIQHSTSILKNIEYLECSSNDRDGSRDNCDGEEMKKETQGQSKCELSFPGTMKSCEFEENVERDVDNDDGESNYNDDIDDYLVSSLASR